MELLKRCNLPWEDSKANWSKERGVCRILEHSKIIGARKLTKKDVDHARSNFRVFWPTGRWEKWYGTPKHGGEDING